MRHRKVTRLVRYKRLIPMEINVPSEPTGDINPEPRFNEFLLKKTLQGFSMVLGSAEHRELPQDEAEMECTAPKHPGQGTSLTLSRFWEGVWESARAGRCRGRELWLSCGTGEAWELLDIWSHHLFHGEINIQGVAEMFSSSILLG